MAPLALAVSRAGLSLSPSLAPAALYNKFSRHPMLNVQNFPLIDLCDLFSGRCPSHSVGPQLGFRVMAAGALAGLARQRSNNPRHLTDLRAVTDHASSVRVHRHQQTAKGEFPKERCCRRSRLVHVCLTICKNHSFIVAVTLRLWSSSDYVGPRLSFGVATSIRPRTCRRCTVLCERKTSIIRVSCGPAILSVRCRAPASISQQPGNVVLVRVATNNQPKEMGQSVAAARCLI